MTSRTEPLLAEPTSFRLADLADRLTMSRAASRCRALFLVFHSSRRVCGEIARRLSIARRSEVRKRVSKNTNALRPRKSQLPRIRKPDHSNQKIANASGTQTR